MNTVEKAGVFIKRMFGIFSFNRLEFYIVSSLIYKTSAFYEIGLDTTATFT